LARDPAAGLSAERLQLVFSYQGKIIAVVDSGYGAPDAGITSYHQDSPDSRHPIAA